MNRRRFVLAPAAAAVLPAWPTRAQIRPFPSQPVRIVVPTPPGGAFDTLARQLADRLAPLLGQSVVVENRAGSGTLLGTDAAAKAIPDGHTLLLGALSNIALNPGLYPRLPYQPLRDFKPIGLAVSYSYTLIARKNLRQRSLVEVVREARERPDTLTYASAGNGSGQHVAAALLFGQAQVKLVHVPYRGVQAAYQDLLGDRVDLLFDISPVARAHVDAGSVTALAVSSRERQPFHPQTPSVRETGVAPLEMESWFGLFAPSGVPAAALERLRNAFGQVMGQADLAQRIETLGGRVLRMSTAQTETFVKEEVAKWTQLVRDAHITAD